MVVIIVRQEDEVIMHNLENKSVLCLISGKEGGIIYENSTVPRGTYVIWTSCSVCSYSCILKSLPVTNYVASKNCSLMFIKDWMILLKSSVSQKFA